MSSDRAERRPGGVWRAKRWWRRRTASGLRGGVEATAGLQAARHFNFCQGIFLRRGVDLLLEDSE